MSTSTAFAGKPSRRQSHQPCPLRSGGSINAVRLAVTPEIPAPDNLGTRTDSEPLSRFGLSPDVAGITPQGETDTLGATKSAPRAAIRRYPGMTTHRTLATALGLTTAALGAGLATAAPASAGGVIVVASPSFDNSCANHGTAKQSAGRTTHGSGTVGGNLAALPAATPLNQCGGADIPIIQERDTESYAIGGVTGITRYHLRQVAFVWE